MALTEAQENKVIEMLAAFENGKRINELDDAQGAVGQMQIEVMDETGETRKMELGAAVEVASNPIAGRYWNEDNSTPTAAGYYGSLQALRDLPKKLGLGRYLVTDDRQRRKLDPVDSTRFEDGSPAALDGSMGQCMWCWNAHYFTTWKEGNNTVMAVTFAPIEGKKSVYVPAGGISWMDAAVMDRTNTMLCSVISDAEQYRGGNGKAMSADTYKEIPADTPQLTMLGMPATAIGTTNFGAYARKRGEGWESNWFVARAVVEYLFEIIMGTRNSQAAFNAELDENGLYQGGFGSGVTTMNYDIWNGFNGCYPLVPTSVGLEAGDGVTLVDYEVLKADGTSLKAFKVPVFFGLVNAGFGHLTRWVRGLILSQEAGVKSEVFVAPSLYAGYDPTTVDGMVKVAECPQTEGYIKKKSYNGLCCMPTEVGGSASTYFADYFYTNAKDQSGLRVRGAGGSSHSGTAAGASCTSAHHAATPATALYSSPLCFFAEDPTIEA